MLVYGKRTQTRFGAYGVFVCESLKGDKLLRELENPAHDEWKAGNWRGSNNRRMPEGEQALDEIQGMISKSLTDFFADASESALSITGLDEYLYIPEDLLDDESRDHELGQPTGDFKDMGQSLSTDIINDCRQREEDDLANVGSVKIITSGSQDPQDVEGEEDPYGTGGHSRRNVRTKGGKPMAGRQVSTATIVNEDGTHKVHIPVNFRVCAQNEKGQMYHNIIVHAPHDIENGEIEIVTIGEQSDDAVDIVYCDRGECDKNLITDIDFKAGRNTIRVLFSDNMRHSIKLKAYENK